MWTLLHGFTGAPDSWSLVLSEGSFEAPPAVPWLLGHGPDWKSRAVDSFEEECRRVQLRCARRQRPRLLCGYSLGARVALGVLTLDPRLFDAAVLIGVHPGLDDAGERAQRREDDAVRAHALRNDRLAAFVDRWEEMPLFASQRGLPDTLLEKQREDRLAHDAEGLARALEVLGLAEMPSYGPGMASLDVPIILMAGSLDEKFSALAQLLAARHRNVAAEIVPGVGHNLLLEAPKAVAHTLKRAQGRALR